MRLVVQDHPVGDIGASEGPDLPRHLHEVHHLAYPDMVGLSSDELDVLHLDDHDDLRRGCAL